MRMNFSVSGWNEIYLVALPVSVLKGKQVGECVTECDQLSGFAFCIRVDQPFN
jgi:hypothetical protein